MEYIFCPGLHLAERAELAIEYLENPFSLVCSDDDGLIESQINKMMYFLESNGKYASVGGCAVGAYPYAGVITGAVAYREMQGYESSSEDNFERIRKHLVLSSKNLTPRAGMYRLYRKEYMIALLSCISKCRNFSTPYIYEVASEFVAARVGPTIYLPYLYWIRNWHTKMVSNAEWNRDLDFCHWWDNEKYLEENNKFIALLADDLKLDLESVRELISTYYERRASLIRQPSKGKWKKSIILSAIKEMFYRYLLPKKSPIQLNKLLDQEFPNLISNERQEIEGVVEQMFVTEFKSRRR